MTIELRPLERNGQNRWPKWTKYWLPYNFWFVSSRVFYKEILIWMLIQNTYLKTWNINVIPTCACAEPFLEHLFWDAHFADKWFDFRKWFIVNIDGNCCSRWRHYDAPAQRHFTLDQSWTFSRGTSFKLQHFVNNNFTENCRNFARIISLLNAERNVHLVRKTSLSLELISLRRTFYSSSIGTTIPWML